MDGSMDTQMVQSIMVQEDEWLENSIDIHTKRIMQVMMVPRIRNGSHVFKKPDIPVYLAKKNVMKASFIML